MKRLIDKAIILAVLLAFYVSNTNSPYMIVPILATIICSAIISYFEKQFITIVIFVIYIIASLFIPALLFLVPLLCYDVVLMDPKWLWALSVIPLILNFTEVQPESRLLIAAFILFTYVLKSRTVSLQILEKDYHVLRDNAKEISMQLEKQNKELLEKQDYEINLATLTERNRIARDIHDNVGHLLSRCILQIGALLAINKDDKTKESLVVIKDTLSEAMDSIRDSVHNLHEKAIDLHTEIQKLIENFNFCPISFDYDIESNIKKDIKNCFITITKEALSNIIKHSNATEASITVREHPSLYQLIIKDNGSPCNYNSENGIGIKNITDRVTSLGGNVNISTDKGFRIFISIPKK
ncbi:Sensor histidine kinase yxjM [Proteiniborus sp. DW1]|uniref:sensor histidine kinase n=1 Tax=Proteiniborus sp. DW1 TaxID=1889883 RepID=UPI00092DFCF9|nr:sensor histidine kinase [Proteiniborus sp. DW1]SCG82184.1 Sensor histidine kinase yxjM [Proteiniborus sp. DW1]